MPSIITPSELSSALNGVSSSLYSDAILDEIIDTAESVVGNLLVQHGTQQLTEHSSESIMFGLITQPNHTNFMLGKQLQLT
jgi:hypothetical protein